MIFIGLIPMKKAPHPFANDENHTSNVGFFASAQTRPQMIYTGIYFSTTLPKTEAIAGDRLSFPPEERRPAQSTAKKTGLALTAAKPSACGHRLGRCAGASPGISLGRRVRNTVEKSETEGGREDK
jgi:hypothetical protein